MRRRMFGMYGKLKAHEGQGDALLAKLLRAAELMESAPGCLLYVVNRSADDADTLWVTEIWSDEAAHGASLSMAGVRDLVTSTMPLLAEKPDGIKIKPIAGKGLAALGAVARPT